MCFGLEQRAVAVQRRGRCGIDEHPAIAIDVEHALHVEHVDGVVVAECHGSRALAQGDGVVQELEPDALVAASHPGEEHIRDPGVGLDRVRQGVVHRLVAAELEPALPRALHQLLGRRDHEEQVRRLAESGQQVASLLVRVRREAVEAEAVDQQVRHFALRVLARHVAVELLIDDLQLLGRECARILVGGAEGAVVEQLLAPDIGTDQREIAPAHADIAGEPPLQRAQRALARGRSAFGVDDDRAGPAAAAAHSPPRAPPRCR